VEEERAYIDLLLDPMRLALIEVISATKSWEAEAISTNHHQQLQLNADQSQRSDR
jgi:hypothetical protein